LTPEQVRKNSSAAVKGLRVEADATTYMPIVSASPVSPRAWGSENDETSWNGAIADACEIAGLVCEITGLVVHGPASPVSLKAWGREDTVVDFVHAPTIGGRKFL